METCSRAGSLVFGPPPSGYFSFLDGSYSNICSVSTGTTLPLQNSTFSPHFLRPHLFEVLGSPTERPKTFVWISGVPKFVPPTPPASLLQLRSSPLCSRKLGLHLHSRHLPLPGVVTTGLPVPSGAHYSTYSVRPSSKACLALRPPAPCLCLNADRICILHHKGLQLVTPYL